MSKFYQTKKFKDLNKKWTKRLEASGFKDIEHNEDTLTAYSTKFLNHPSYVWDLKSAYYSMCESFLQSYQFATPREQVVWEYHTNGLGTRAIAKIFNAVRKKKVTHVTIWRIVSRLETVMKETYLFDQTEGDSEH